jgi:hypothetical protein
MHILEVMCEQNIAKIPAWVCTTNDALMDEARRSCSLYFMWWNVKD